MVVAWQARWSYLTPIVYKATIYTSLHTHGRSYITWRVRFSIAANVSRIWVFTAQVLTVNVHKKPTRSCRILPLISKKIWPCCRPTKATKTIAKNPVLRTYSSIPNKRRFHFSLLRNGKIDQLRKCGNHVCMVNNYSGTVHCFEFSRTIWFV